MCEETVILRDVIIADVWRISGRADSEGMLGVAQHAQRSGLELRALQYAYPVQIRVK